MEQEMSFEETVISVVSSSFADSVETVAKLTQADQKTVINRSIKLVYALRTLSVEAQEKVAVPMIETLVDKLDIDLTDMHETEVELIAMAVSDATNAIMNQMQMDARRQQAAQQAIATGQPGLIKS